MGVEWNLLAGLDPQLSSNYGKGLKLNTWFINYLCFSMLLILRRSKNKHIQIDVTMCMGGWALMYTRFRGFCPAMGGKKGRCFSKASI